MYDGAVICLPEEFEPVAELVAEPSLRNGTVMPAQLDRIAVNSFPWMSNMDQVGRLVDGEALEAPEIDCWAAGHQLGRIVGDPRNLQITRCQCCTLYST